MEHQLTKEELRNTKINRKEFKNIKRNNIYIVLDNFKVHYNIGIVFRLADAVLAKKVYLCGTTCTPPNIKIKKTSIGAEKWVPYEYVENTLDIVKNCYDCCQEQAWFAESNAKEATICYPFGVLSCKEESREEWHLDQEWQTPNSTKHADSIFTLSSH